MRALRPTTHAAFAFIKLFKSASDASLARSFLLRTGDPADEFVSRKGGDVTPRGFSRSENFATLSGHNRSMSDSRGFRKRCWRPCSWFRHSSVDQSATDDTASESSTLELEPDGSSNTEMDESVTPSGKDGDSPSHPRQSDDADSGAGGDGGELSAADRSTHNHMSELPEESRRVLEKAQEVFSQLPGPIAPER